MFDDETIQGLVRFHGHMCPGLAMGVRAAEVALEQIGPRARGEEVVAIVESDMCPVDAIQYLTGCTFGLGALVHRDHGKNAFTFVRGSDGKAIRVRIRPGGGAPPDPEWESMFTRVRAGTATAEERERFQARHVERAHVILRAPIDEVCEVQVVHEEMPRRVRSQRRLICAECGEETADHRITRAGDRDLCAACFERVGSAPATPVAVP